MNKILALAAAALLAIGCNRCQNSTTTDAPESPQDGLPVLKGATADAKAPQPSADAFDANFPKAGVDYPYEGYAGAYRFESRTIEKQSCTDKGVCTQFRAVYPVFSLGNPQPRQYLNASVYNYYQSMAGAPPGNGDIAAMMQTVQNNFIDAFDKQKAQQPDVAWFYEMVTTLPLTTPEYLTFYARTRFFDNQSAANRVVGLTTFDLKTGLPMQPGQVFADTASVMKIIETAYMAKNKLANASELSAHLRPEFAGKLPFPLNFGVVPEGVYFRYNNWEVTHPSNPGAVDILLSWAEMGRAIDKRRFVK